jgi:hypothetical protein
MSKRLLAGWLGVSLIVVVEGAILVLGTNLSGPGPIVLTLLAAGFTVLFGWLILRRH